MAKPTKKGVLTALAGKTVFFSGKFEWGEENRLTLMAQAHQGSIAKDLSPKVDYLVLADPAAGKTIQKKAASLNAKGAQIQAINIADFEAIVTITQAQVLSLLRGGKEQAELLARAMPFKHAYIHGTSTPAMTIAAENFDDCDLTGFHLVQIAFNQCSFVGATLTSTKFDSASNCDFQKSKGESVSFGDVEASRFNNAQLVKSQFEGNIANTDFSDAVLDQAEFSGKDYVHSPAKAPQAIGCLFTSAKLRKAKFSQLSFKAPDFDGADLSDVVMNSPRIESGSFRKANLSNTTFVDCKLTQADLTSANLSGANFAGADLTDAKIDGADLANCNLRGANLNGVDLKKAKNYDANKMTGGALGPALKELDSIATKAKRLCITLRIADSKNGEGDEVTIDTSYLKHGWLRPPASLSLGLGYSLATRSKLSPSDALLRLSNMLGNWKLRYETVEVQTTKSPKAGKELRDIVINSLVEAFAQPLPPADELAAAAKTFQENERAKTSAQRQKREKEKAKIEKKKTAEKKQIATKIAKQVGKVTDIATFLKALELRADKQKIDKATKMLKASGFQLFNDVTDDHLNGVVKSQTDPDLVYACRLESTGHYACCTQNLNICGGLRGSICKHLLVLIIGLVQAGTLDPTTIDTWIAKSHDTKPELNKETMGDIFIRYKGAEAGEVDWRPTETVPEDYYAL